MAYQLRKNPSTSPPFLFFLLLFSLLLPLLVVDAGHLHHDLEAPVVVGFYGNGGGEDGGGGRNDGVNIGRAESGERFRRSLDDPILDQVNQQVSQQVILEVHQQVSQPHDLIRPENCSFSPSCSHREASGGPEQFLSTNLIESDEYRYPCHCDEECGRYGDCCPDVVSEEAAPQPFTCRALYPSLPIYPDKHVYMVSSCPDYTPPYLADRCAGTFGAYTYLMDVPVMSAQTNTLYANLFCAQCNNDAQVKDFPLEVMCPPGFLKETTDLSTMMYHPGQLTWKAEGDGEAVCSLRVDYGKDVGRRCEEGLVEACGDGWEDKEMEARCASYSYYVYAAGEVYRNWDCAVCNGVPEDAIQCLSMKPPVRGIEAPFIPSLTDLFSTGGDCDDDQVWDPLYKRCEHVSCGYLFTLKDGECVLNDNTGNSRDKRSYLNSSCYTTEFQRSYSVVLPNQSVYLNYTEQLYHPGQYEFVNHSWVRVCRPEELWTPGMNILSTILICISLVCMLLHIIIFLLLPRRRNIPSMNLFSMTCSLFIAELMFVSLFRANQYYGLCAAFGAIMYYFLLAAFLWMNVMSIDICRTFHSNRYKIKSRKNFIQYSAWAWGAPLVCALLAVVVDQATSSSFVLTPGFGTHNCWFNNKWGLVSFFTVPSGFIVLFNIVLFGISVYDIYKQHKSGEFASATVRRPPPLSRRDSKKERQRFIQPAPLPPEPKKEKSFFKTLIPWQSEKEEVVVVVEPTPTVEPKKGRMAIFKPILPWLGLEKEKETFIEPPAPPPPPKKEPWYLKPLTLFADLKEEEAPPTPPTPASGKKRLSKAGDKSGEDSDSSLRRHSMFKDKKILSKSGDKSGEDSDSSLRRHSIFKDKKRISKSGDKSGDDSDTSSLMRSPMLKDKKRLSKSGDKSGEDSDSSLRRSMKLKDKIHRKGGYKSGDDSDSLTRTNRLKEKIQRRLDAHKKQRLRLILYCKLAIMMGLTWVFAFVSIHTKSLTFEFLFIIFNGLQGTFIFIAFDCKQKVYEELRQRFGWLPQITRGAPKASSTSVTKQTSVSGASDDEKHRFKWTSSRRSTWHAASGKPLTLAAARKELPL